MDALIGALTDLRPTAVAATRKDNHARLWVDEKNGVRVQVADREGKQLADLVFGRYLPENQETLLRRHEQDVVVNVPGWLGEKVERKLEDWRERFFFRREPTQVQKLSFSCPDAELAFEREGESWKPIAGQKPIPNLDSKQLDNRAASLARFRASGFAEQDVDATQAGTTQDSLRHASFETNEDPPRSLGLRLGGPAGTVKRDDGTDKQMFYVQHDDDPVVYTTSEYLRDYLCPTPKTLAQQAGDAEAKE
jgi:hypothetical protein